MIHRRALLRGLFATPAIVAASSLMPIRGVPLIPGWTDPLLPDGGALTWSTSGYSGPIKFLLNQYGVWENTDAGWVPLEPPWKWVGTP